MMFGLKKQQSKGRLGQIARDLEANGALDAGGNSLSPNSVRSMLNAFRKPLGLPLLEPEKKTAPVVGVEKLQIDSTLELSSNYTATITNSGMTASSALANSESAGTSGNKSQPSTISAEVESSNTNTTITVAEIEAPRSSTSVIPEADNSVAEITAITTSEISLNTLPKQFEAPVGLNLTINNNKSCLSQGVDLTEANITNNNESDMSWKTTCSVSPAPAFSSEVESQKSTATNHSSASCQSQPRLKSAYNSTKHDSGLSTMTQKHIGQFRSSETNQDNTIFTPHPKSRASNNFTPENRRSTTKTYSTNLGDPELEKENKTVENLVNPQDPNPVHRSNSLYAHADTNIEGQNNVNAVFSSKTYYRIPLPESQSRLSNSNASVDVNKKALTTGLNVYTNPYKDLRSTTTTVSTVDNNERPIFNSAITCPQSQSNDINRKTATYGIAHIPFSKQQARCSSSDNYSAEINKKTATLIGMSGELRGGNTGDTNPNQTFKKLSSASFSTPMAKGTMKPSTGSNSRAPSTQKTGNVNASKKKQANFWKLTTEKVCDTSYLILKQLGKGGCGEVYLVMENDSRELHALKKVNMQQLDNAGVQECINEVQMLLALRDTELVIHIVEWEVDHTNHVLKIVMEYGQCDLSKTIISRSSTLTKVKACWENMLLIVQAIHSKGIVHGDLKPANFVWVAGRLKIIDFGIANRLQTDVTSIQTYNPKGTLNFMSPESIRPDAYGRAKIGPKSDIWSLGCILYLMVYGCAPFQNYQNQIAKMNAIINGTIEYPPLPLNLHDARILDVLKLCFQLDSRNRPDATGLLSHPFLNSY